MSKFGDVKKNQLDVCCEVCCSTITEKQVCVYEQTLFRSESMKMGCTVSIQPEWELCGLLSDVYSSKCVGETVPAKCEVKISLISRVLRFNSNDVLSANAIYVHAV